MYTLTDRNRKRRHRRKWRDAAIKALGGRCSQCGFADRRAFHIDHVNGGGQKDIASFNHDYSRYHRHVVNNAESNKYQLLCANCHCIKHGGVV